ncbi:MAG: T9SS type A sorting domain-containing protein [bacterium]
MELKRKAITAVLLALASTAWAAWQSEIVASEGNVGAGCSLATDRWERPHISYVDITQGKVMYARYTGSSWEFQTIASDVDVQGDTAIALDAFDNPHVIFQDGKTEEVTYAYISGSSWRTEKIDGGANYGQYVSISAWPLGRRVSYTKPAGMEISLEYAYRDVGGWEPETVVSKGGGEFNTVFIDENDNPNIVYYNSSTLSIKHAVRKNNEWSIDDIAEGVDCGAFVGPNNKVHVSFAKANNAGLNYAVSTAGGSWNIENVNAAKGEPAFTDICVNGAGNVFISYFNFYKSNLHVVTKKGGSWSRELVATGGYVGRPHSIAPGPDGYPLIAYYDATRGNLKLAHHVFTDVDLKSFTARRSAGGAVDVRWAVGRTGAVAGYNIYRVAENGEREKVNTALITGMSPFLFRDAEAAEDVALEYWLEAVAYTGKGQTFGPATVPPAKRPSAFALHQNAPNPVAGATTFSFELPEGANITLGLFDAAGRKVAAVAEGYFAAGRYDLAFHVHLAPGVYVYRLDAGSRTAARKMVVVK